MANKPQSKKKKIQAASPELLRELASLPEFDIAAMMAAQLRRQRWREAGMVGLLLFMLLLYCVMALRPPYVIDRDRAVGKPPQIVVPGKPPPIEAHDAAKFFVFVQRLRYGWDSATVVRDFEHLQALMTKNMRTAFLKYVNSPPEPADSQSPAVDERRLSRVQGWIAERVVNQLSLSIADVDCRQSSDGEWLCRADGFIETLPLAVPTAQVVAVRRRVEFRAKFKEAPYFKDEVRIWGLGISYVDALNLEKGA